MFDVDSFLSQQIDQSLDTKVTPPPIGEWQGVIEDVKARQWTKKDDPSKSGVALDVTWSLTDPTVLAHCARDKVTVRQGIMLDTDGGSLALGPGKNIGLGRLREAVGLNTPGQPFSFAMLVGRMAKVKVAHRIEGEDVYGEVKGVARIA